MYLFECDFEQNESENSYGGAIYYSCNDNLNNDYYLNIEDSRINGNNSPSGTAGLFVQSSEEAVSRIHILLDNVIFLII